MSERELPPLLHSHFSDRVARSPDRVALLQDDRAVTFRELGEKVDRLVGGLRREGLGNGCMVGLHMDRSIDWVACTLATLCVNAAAVPLPPSYPKGRLREILGFARLDAVVYAGGSAFERALAGRAVEFESLLAAGVSSEPSPVGDPDQPAFVLCTSGSTGHPKMIVRSHRSFFHRLRWTWEQHPFAPEERGCQKAHMTTTHALYELFEPLLAGVPVVLIADHQVRDLEQFWDTIRVRQVSRLLLVPSHLQASLGMPGFAPPSLNVLVLMGEYVSPTLAEQALSAFPEATSIYSIYGSTEASSVLICDLRASLRAGEELPLGRPIAPDITVAVLDADGRPVPAGATGRLHVGGSPLFSGYFRDPELTASVLIQGSRLIEGSHSSDRLYDTGDDVRRTDSGALEFIGRADQTVKIRGFRVDIKEVEATLLSHPGVREAAVVEVEAGGRGQALGAFVAPTSIELDGLYQTLRERLPDYMVPSGIITLDSLPRTASGKIDRRGLRASPPRGTPPSPSRSTLSDSEREVAEVWDEILDRPDLPPDVSFFEAGGSSLSAFSLVHQLRERFDLDRRQLDVESVYRAPTIRELAAHIEQARQGKEVPAGTLPTALVPLRKGRGSPDPPVFFVAPAGGTLGAYGKLARVLRTPRELIGLRDPLIWEGRDASMGFEPWVDLYLQEIRKHQPEGPYFLVAYSSAASFGYEMARRLRRAGEPIGLLALIDPFGLDRGGRSRFGWWVAKAATATPTFRMLIRLVGLLHRTPLGRIPVRFRLGGQNAPAPDLSEEAPRLMEAAGRNRAHLRSLSALLELNTGLPYALDPDALDGIAPEASLDALRERVETLSPAVDFDVIERVVRQYPLQVRAQECYELQPFDGEVLLVEASTPYAGLLGSLLRPYVKGLRTRVVKVGVPSDRIQRISEQWGGIAPHYRAMRDDEFVEGLAKELDERLD